MNSKKKNKLQTNLYKGIIPAAELLQIIPQNPMDIKSKILTNIICKTPFAGDYSDSETTTNTSDKGQNKENMNPVNCIAKGFIKTDEIKSLLKPSKSDKFETKNTNNIYSDKNNFLNISNENNRNFVQNDFKAIDKRHSGISFADSGKVPQKTSVIKKAIEKSMIIKGFREISTCIHNKDITSEKSLTSEVMKNKALSEKREQRENDKSMSKLISEMRKMYKNKNDVNVTINVDGNLIGNNEFMEYMSRTLAKELTTRLAVV